ncbi:MAG: translation initiation factor IF-2 [Eubacteriales bacterium]|nr:translation initiation factor IF-2 [Eubacteriales bacterium]
MAKNNVLKVTDELKGSSQELLKKIQETRRRTQEQLNTLKGLEEAVKTKQREESLKRAAEEAAAAEAAPVSALEAPAPQAPAAQSEPSPQPAPAPAAAQQTPAPQGQATYQQRPQGQATYQPRPQGQATYQQRPQGQATYQPRPQGQATYQPRPQGQGGYQQRPQGQGGYQQRPQGQGGYQPRPQGQGGYQQRPQGQGGYQPRPQGQGGYGQRPQGQGAPRPAGVERKQPLVPTKSSAFNPNKGNYERRNTNDEYAARKAGRTGEPNRRQLLLQGDDDMTMGSRRKLKRVPKQQRIERKIIETATISGETVPIKVLAEKIGKPAVVIVKKLLVLGILANINQDIDYDTAASVAAEFDVILEQEIAKTHEEVMVDAYDEAGEDEDTQPRAPIVTIMGHVDHGKTSVLDAIRKSRVTATEAGGITQHIGAYQVDVKGRTITFLDTPGHEAFTSMRARGAQATDIAVLVVAADDGVMPQTVEAINHAKAAGVPIIVAINKMDRPGANPERVKQQLTEYELVCEEWGGDTVMANVSALTGEGLDTLMDMILLVADVQELRANPDRSAKGIIIEAKLDKNRGPVASVLVQNGTLHVGDMVVVGTTFGRVRAMFNDLGERVEIASPSTPVELLGLEDAPDTGELLYAVAEERIARQVAEERAKKLRETQMTPAALPVTLDDLFNRVSQGDMKELNIIIKADVRGSAEAVKSSLEKLSTPEVRIKTIHSGVGAINENDIMLAATSNAIVIGFNVQPNPQGRAAAEREGVDVRVYRIIYNAIEDMQKALNGMLEPEFKEVVSGHVEVRSVFKITGVGAVAGCYVTDGKIVRQDQVRITRDSVIIFEGKLSSLKRFKDDVKEVAAGYECGVTVDGYNDIKEGDVIEAYNRVEIERED